MGLNHCRGDEGMRNEKMMLEMYQHIVEKDLALLQLVKPGFSERSSFMANTHSSNLGSSCITLKPGHSDEVEEHR